MPTQNPTVSFVVPCYKLAHLLPECVNSILSQTYGDFEVLIMDDCSPDNTAEVARSFQDPRVKHIRNDPNLGALPNYNKGISLSRGKYVWLISADDYLRRPYVLQRYVDLMDANPRVGYTFCPCVGVRNRKETEKIDWSAYGSRDRIVDGRVFLQKLLDYNLVLGPATMARRECYEKISFFPINPVWAGVPIDLIWGGDWYLWCLFALHGDVGYFAEPMVCYREHELSSTSIVTNENLENCFRADIAVPWMIKQKADEAGFRDVSRKCLHAIAYEYARHLATKEYRSGKSTITLQRFEESLCRNTPSEKERNWVRTRVYANVADRYYGLGNYPSAKQFYLATLRKDPLRVKEYAKMFLLSLGKPGNCLRKGFRRGTGRT